MLSFRDLAVVVIQIVEAVAIGSQGLINGTIGWCWQSNTLDNWNDRRGHRLGLAPGAVKDTEQDTLGITPTDICRMIPEDFRILAIESIRREEMTRLWSAYREELKSRISRELDVERLSKKPHPLNSLRRRDPKTLLKQEIIDEMVKPHVTFRGTTHATIPSIVEHGFLRPGTVVDGHKVASPRSNTVFCRGIYSSQDPRYALSYSQCHGMRSTTPGELPGLRLIVCATLLGRTLSDPTRVYGKKQYSYDAHFDGLFEYIVYENRAMLPCYVVHLDLGDLTALRAIQRIQRFPRAGWWRWQEPPSDPIIVHKDTRAPGDRQREDDARKMAGLKWFPYGYGPSTGTRFKVDEIAPHDDDDEPHGPYHYMYLLKNFIGKSGRVLTWMDVLKEDEGLLVHMFKEIEPGDVGGTIDSVDSAT